MGAESFTTNVIKAPTIAAAFSQAIEDARHESGHGGYSGTIAEKDDFVLCSKEVLVEDDAYRLARKLMDDGDQRISDKWGPAGAIAVVSTTRTMTQVVELRDGPERRSVTQSPEGLLEFARSRCKVARGEKIVSARLSTTSPTTIGLYLTIRKSGAGKIIKRTVTLTVPLGTDSPDFHATVEKALLAKLQLLPGSVLGDYRPVVASRKTKTVTVRGAGRVTRYVVLGDPQHQTFAGGFATLALANKHVRELVASPSAQWSYEVQGVIRAADANALAATTVKTISTKLTIDVEITTNQQLTGCDGWIFFGWASS
jgi:hypothetical protein